MSSLRVPFLPELELLILILIFLLGNNMLFGAAIIIVLCSHHYVIPDAVYRFDSSDYPSIYTKKIFFLKTLDLLVLLMSLYSLKIFNYSFASKYKLNLNYPIILLIFCFLGFVSTPILYQKFDLMFFNLRSLLLLVSTYVIFKTFSLQQLKVLSFLALSSWISKMFFSIIFPAENPLYRQIFGVEWNLYFAGDEYLTLGVYFISILFIEFHLIDDSLKKSSGLVKYLIWFSLLLALIAQRKGALIYFFEILILVQWPNSSKLRIFQNMLIFIMPFSTFLFLTFILPNLPEIMSFAFIDQVGLLDSAIGSLQSLFTNDFWHFLVGLGPYSMYEVKNLDLLFDNEMAFGSEVGSTYRYMIWSLPYGRLILNVGFLGFVIYVWYLLKNLSKHPYYFYLYSLVLTLFFLENISPVTSLSMGFALVILSKYRSIKLRKSYTNLT